MADARLHIVNKTLGIGCRLYARLGDAYTPGHADGLAQLLERVSKELVTDDNFIIIDTESNVDKIEGTMLVKVDLGNPPKYVLKEELDRCKERLEEEQKESRRLTNKCTMLAQRHINGLPYIDLP